MTRLQKLRVIAGRRAGEFAADEGGATAIEYAIIAAGVSGVVIAAVSGLGSHLKTTFYDKLTALLP